MELRHMSGASAAASVAVSLSASGTTHHGHAPLTLAFEHILHSTVLRSVTGYAVSGSMTAILGSSRDGKAALLRILAGHEGLAEECGHVYLNGHKVTAVELRRYVGYCAYQHIHWEAATIREVVTFNAFLRVSAEISESERLASVAEWLQTLELTEIADASVQSCSQEQMVRVKIAAELVAGPHVLVLDEPLRGLDEQALKRIVLILRKLVKSGYTVISTLSESSSLEALRSFDRLVLLTRSGEVAFNGELGADCRHLVKYLQAAPGVKKLPSGKAPALWALECIGANATAAHTSASGKAADEKEAKFVKMFSESELKRVLVTHMDQHGVLKPAGKFPVTHYRVVSYRMQLTLLIKRFVFSYWRTFLYSRVRNVNVFMLFVLFAWIFFKQEEEYDTYEGVNGGVQTLFFSSLLLGFLSFVSVLYSSTQEMVCFGRDVAVQAYQSHWYFVAQTVVDVLISFVASFVFLFVFFRITGFLVFVFDSWSYWLSLAFYLLIQMSAGHLVAYWTKRVDYAAFIGVAWNLLVVVLSSIMWSIEYFPYRYLLANLVGLLFGDCRRVVEEDGVERDVVVACKQLRFAPAAITRNGELTVRSYVEQEFRSAGSEEAVAWNLYILIGFFVLFRFIVVFVMRRQHRVTYYHSSASSSTTVMTHTGGVTTVRKVTSTTTVIKN
uniref:ABC transporter domain-containing protein n=1 Tax=Globisporangium ultimum (strain ATCC 200006 / CBS 805.95 / DAOM BR144) TaxID=431595 RepID=K3WN03_GLOUD